ncbi:MAG: serine/threonine protein kinase [Planctomycetes bacterium]|nr:serine/threonine protein kinase [Planctomycetota bacterium]
MRDQNTAPSRESTARNRLLSSDGDTPTRLAINNYDPAASPPAGQPSDELRVLGPYDIIRMLGQGGMGLVLLGHDPTLDRLVAIKLLRSDRTDAESRQRFVREARAVAAIQHDHVVTIHSVANPRSGLPYFVMPYIAGPTLRQQIDADTQFEPARSAQLAIEIASGLSAAHEAGLVHRDIKPDNVMLDPVDGRAKIMDFGLVRLAESDVITQTGTSAGTPEYMSPEQIDKPGSVDQRTDVYSLGVTLYEMLTGTRPFAGAPHMIMQQVLSDEPRRPRKLNDRIPRDLEIVCLRAIEKDPARRYQTAADFGDDLGRWLRGEAIIARSIGPVGRLLRWRRRQAALANLATALVVVIAVAIGAVLIQWRRAEYHLAESRRQEVQRIAKEAEVEDASRHVAQASKEVEQASQQAEDASREAEQARGQILTAILYSQVRQDTRPDNAMRKFFEALSSMPMKVINEHGDDPEKAVEVAAAYMSLGQLKWRSGDQRAALGAYNAARQRYSSLSGKQPEDANLRHLLATAHHWAGILQQEFGEVTAALEAHEQARRIQRELVERSPTAPNYLLDLANSEIEVGTLQATLGKNAEATAAHEEARRALRRIERANAGTTIAAMRKELAIAYRKLGDGLRLHSSDATVSEVYQQAIDFGRAASSGSPAQIDVQSELAIALNQFGECLIESGRLDEASHAFKEAVLLQRKVVKRSPLTETQNWFRVHLKNLAQVERRLGNLQLAVEAIVERQAITRGDADEVLWSALEIARCLSQLESSPNAGTSGLHREFTSLALAALSHAVEIGFEDTERLKTEPALAPLREMPEFQQHINSGDSR